MQVQLVGPTSGLGAAYTAGGDGTFGAASICPTGQVWCPRRERCVPESWVGPGRRGDMMGLNEFGQVSRSIWPTLWGLASAVSAGASAYHGYKRNDSVGWAIVWGLLGGMFPIITPAIALAEGFAKPKGS